MILRKIKSFIRLFKITKKQQSELLWSQVWHDTINGIDWLKELPSLSPGRYAVGYNYLYVLTRILNDGMPKKILDLGLGISSTLIAKYASSSSAENVEHVIIEHDKTWADFYQAKHKLTAHSRICFTDLTTKKYQGIDYCAYTDISDFVNGKKFDVISIDAPFGNKGPKYARRDILKFLPDILEDDFCIILDDAERNGEKKTISQIEEILKKANIKYHKNIYTGLKDCCVIASASREFFCSL